MKYYLAPSILAADFNHLGSQIETVEAAGAQWLHIDVMDGMFVPNFSVGVPVVESIRKTSGLFFDVHLMIESPIRYIRQFAEAGADSITFHIEAVNDPIRVIEEIRAMDRKVGVSVKPRTPLSMIEPILDQIDMVLVMTVEPGFGGQAFKPEMYEKITELRRMLDKRGLKHVNIEVDGGIRRSNVEKAMDAGANVIVAGSAVFGGNAEKNVRNFMDLFARREAEDASVEESTGK